MRSNSPPLVYGSSLGVLKYSLPVCLWPLCSQDLSHQFSVSPQALRNAHGSQTLGSKGVLSRGFFLRALCALSSYFPSSKAAVVHSSPRVFVLLALLFRTAGDFAQQFISLPNFRFLPASIKRLGQ